jgi:hypothetical protein
MNPFFYSEEAGAKEPPLSPAPQIPAQPKPSLRSGRVQLTMPNNSCTIITPGSLRLLITFAPERRSASFRNLCSPSPECSRGPVSVNGPSSPDRMSPKPAYVSRGLVSTSTCSRTLSSSSSLVSRRGAMLPKFCRL